MHILPQLRKLEQKYRETLAVVGVHSSKFPNERETANLRHAVHRYGIEHPVVNDRDFAIWQSYGVRAWPSMMFIDPVGKVIGKHEGEFEFAIFDRLITGMTAEFETAGVLDRTLLPHQVASIGASSAPIAYPGKIEIDPAVGELLIADSNHNRIIFSTPDGEVIRVVGSGTAGDQDGTAENASFWGPQGIAFDDNNVYVADAENHLVRRIERKSFSVETIAGTGGQALIRHADGNAKSMPINSPYDLVLLDDALYVAMAGFHQLWVIDVSGGTMRPFAGDGREDIVDGSLNASRLAQPYGITVNSGTLYFADSETSSIRRAGTGPDGRVETLVGTGLFDFGDRDGVGDAVLLQHVQGLTSGGGSIYFVDTYNHKIKVLDPSTRTVITVAGSGQSGHEDGALLAASFNEPAGLTYHEDFLYVADTNNHAIRKVDIEAGNVSTIELRGL